MKQAVYVQIGALEPHGFAFWQLCSCRDTSPPCAAPRSLSVPSPTLSASTYPVVNIWEDLTLRSFHLTPAHVPLPIVNVERDIRWGHWRLLEPRHGCCLLILRLVSQLLHTRLNRAAYKCCGVFIRQRVNRTCLLRLVDYGIAVRKISMPRTCTSPSMPLPLLNFPGGGSHTASVTYPKRPLCLLLLHPVTMDLLTHLASVLYLVVLARAVPPLPLVAFTLCAATSVAFIFGLLRPP